MSRLIEYGVSQLYSMRARMATCICKSIKARLAWRATPSRDKYVNSKEGLGTRSLAHIQEYALSGYTPFWMQEGTVEPWYPQDRWTNRTEQRGKICA